MESLKLKNLTIDDMAKNLAILTYEDNIKKNINPDQIMLLTKAHFLVNVHNFIVKKGGKYGGPLIENPNEFADRFIGYYYKLPIKKEDTQLHEF